MEAGGRKDSEAEKIQQQRTLPLTICLASAEVYVVVSSSLLHASSSYQQSLTDL